MKIISLFLIGFLFFIFPFNASSYGVLTHEAIIDAAWEKSIMPLLKARYPSSTAEQFKEAHSYAYGGAVAPDMGYYPFGSALFTNLVHYVRSGDMVEALLKDAENVNQYAFALGFLSHYEADNYGHPLATNKSVPLVYPKLQKKFGSTITYADDKISHMRMEFGFDVVQVAKGNYASEAYHGFIGFKVDTTVLAKAFLETYGLDISEVFGNHLNLTVQTFRWIVANIFPFITKTAWVQKKDDILKTNPTATSRSFGYRMHRKQYRNEFGKASKGPGFFASIVSLFIRVIPKVGPLRPLKFKAPTPLAEKYFVQSFDTIFQHYSANLKQLNRPGISLKDLDFDTGKPTERCEYSLADETYQDLVIQLKKDDFKTLDAPLKQNILSFYSGMNAPQKYKKSCGEFFTALSDLKNFSPKP